MKKFIVFILFAIFILPSCGRKIAVKASGIYPQFIADKYVKKYTLLIPEKTSRDYLLFMSTMPYIIFALFLNGYEFRGFNNADETDAPIAIAIALSYNSQTYWSSQLDLTRIVIVDKVSKNRRTITFAAFDNKTKEALWNTRLTGWGRIITGNEKLEIPAILSLGFQAIGKDKTRLITAYPNTKAFIKRYKSFTEDSIKYFNELTNDKEI
ncbi:MAG: hypothetical protein LBL00_06280 [Endomicrobium sp.]|jgi:hypothetical protein|nr:hypothetical protein [Endomicrobium sp.]